MTDKELRDLDARVHQEVMGLECLWGGFGYPGPNWIQSDTFSERRWSFIPEYSTDMAAAWSVVEKLTDGEYVKVRCEQSHYHGDYCWVTATNEPDAGDLVKRDSAEWGESMPIAICLAALKAVEVKRG